MPYPGSRGSSESERRLRKPCPICIAAPESWTGSRGQGQPFQALNAIVERGKKKKKAPKPNPLIPRDSRLAVLRARFGAPFAAGELRCREEDTRGALPDFRANYKPLQG